ncbi:MAG: hypothetical protein QW098_02110 [Candidatus Hadarchaeales archaeon]
MRTKMGVSGATLALSSSRFCLQYSSPKSSLARQSAAVVLPVPGGPEKRVCGKAFVFTKFLSLATISACPTISSSFLGRYFSVQISVSSTLSFS